MRRTLHPTRAGLGRIEVVIVLLIVLVVAGIAAVGLRNWWENAALVRCQFNLEKIGKAIVLYQDQKGKLPASRIAKGYATWAVQLAPYLPEELAAPLPRWDMPLSYYLQLDEVRQAQVPLYYCPARRQPPQLSTSGDEPSAALGLGEGKHYPGALGDYACVSGNGAGDWETADANGAIIPADVLEKDGGLVLRWQALTSLQALPRGQSNTLLIGEKHVPWDQFGVVAAGDGSVYNGDYLASFARVGGPGYGLVSTITDPKKQENFGSYHAGVCQFLLADGSVQAYDTSISEEVLGKLTNRHP
jgi:hypothetical protein